MSQPRPTVTYALIAANVVMFAVEIAAGADAFSPKGQALLPLGADFAPLTLRGEWWRLGASMFLHFGLLHLAMNMICLYQGRIVESIYGKAGFSAIYVASGLIGGVASVARASLAISAGASGAVFGVFGAFGAFLLLRRDRIDPAAWKSAARGLGTFIALNLFISLSAKNIDLSAHVGGLVTGFVVALVVRENHPVRAALAAAVSVAIAIGATYTIPAPDAPPGMSLADDTRALLRVVATADSTCVDRYNDLVTKSKAGTIDDAAFADGLEHDVLPVWRQARATVDAAPTGSDGALYAALRTYMAAQQAWWEALAAAQRGHDPKALDAVEAKHDAAKRAEAAVTQALGN